MTRSKQIPQANAAGLIALVIFIILGLELVNPDLNIILLLIGGWLLIQSFFQRASS